MRRNRVLVILAALLLAVVCFLVFHLYYQSVHETLSQFQENQLLYAKHLSNQIQFYIQNRSRGLRALSSFGSLQKGDVQQMKSDIQDYAKQIEKVYVRAVSLYDEQGTVAYSTDPKIIGFKEPENPFFLWAQRSEKQGQNLTDVCLS